MAQVRASEQAWVQYQHPEYRREQERITFARDHYTGDVLCKLPTYLIQKGQGENNKAYEERAKLADYTNHMAQVVDSLSGMLFNVEKNSNRAWSNEDGIGLGDPTDSATTAGQLWLDADGEGHGWLTLWKLLASELTVVHKAWVLVDSTGPEAPPRVRMLNALDVTNWRFENGVLVEAILKECVDTRASLREMDNDSEQYVHFTTEGWQRYKVVKGTLITMTDATRGDFGSYVYKDRAGNPTLPIFRVTLPIRRQVGWQLAKKANVIFNKESERDNLIRSANFPRLVLAAHDELFDSLKAALAEGSNVLQADIAGNMHTFIAPDSGPATIATEILKRKVEEFYVVAFREYGDSAREKTATEVRQDVSSGISAYLQMLKAALDEAENNAFWRIEQLLDPTNPAKHFIAHVERSEDFAPLDAATLAVQLRDRYFGKDAVLPVGATAKLQIAKAIAELDGITIDEKEMAAAVDARELVGWMGEMPNVEMPAELRVKILERVLVAAKLIDPEDMMEMSDGEQKKLITVILETAREQAVAADEAKRREAENFGAPPVETKPTFGGGEGGSGGGGNVKPHADGSASVDFTEVNDRVDTLGASVEELKDTLTSFADTIQAAIAELKQQPAAPVPPALPAPEQREVAPTPAPAVPDITINVTVPPPQSGGTISIERDAEGNITQVTKE